TARDNSNTPLPASAIATARLAGVGPVCRTGPLAPEVPSGRRDLLLVPEFFRVEVVVIQLYAELQPIEAGVIDLLARRVVRRRHNGELCRRVEEDESLPALRHLRGEVRRQQTLNAFERSLILRPLCGAA